MLKVGNTVQLSASDLVGRLNCPNLTELDLAVAKGETSELDERLTTKPSSSRVSSQWKSWVNSRRKSTSMALVAMAIGTLAGCATTNPLSGDPCLGFFACTGWH
jgi:hypothetical protein